MKYKNSLHQQQKLGIYQCPHLKELETASMTDYENDEVYEEQFCSQCGILMTPTMLKERKDKLKKYKIYE